MRDKSFHAAEEELWQQIVYKTSGELSCRPKLQLRRVVRLADLEWIADVISPAGESAKLAGIRPVKQREKLIVIVLDSGSREAYPA